MANQIIIDIGAAANDGTGDPLRTAFNYVNNNFSNVWNTGLPTSNVQFLDNKILTVNTNANLVLAPNGVGKVTSNVDILPSIANTLGLGSTTRRWNSIYTQFLDVSANVNFQNLNVAGNLTAGNIKYTSNVFVGDLEGSVFDGASSIVLDVIDSAIYVDHYYYANGVPFNNQTYGNANVAAYLPVYNGDIAAGNVSAGNVLVDRLVTSSRINATTGTFYGDEFGDGAIYVGNPAGTVLGSDVVMQITANAGHYSQTNFQNINSGPTASGDYIITADNGDDSTHFIDFGMTSSGWNGSEPNVLDGLTPNNGYLYVQDGNLTLGTRDGSTSYTWNFGLDGNLTTNGNVKLVTNSNLWNFDTSGTLTFPGETLQIGLIGGNSGLRSETSDITIDTTDAGGGLWSFGANGVLDAPGNISASYFIGNGAFLTGVLSQLGNLTINDQTIGGTDINGNIVIAPEGFGTLVAPGVAMPTGVLTAENGEFNIDSVGDVNIRMSAGAANIVTGSDVIPSMHNTYDLGSDSFHYKTIFLGTGGFDIQNDVGNINVTAKAIAGNLVIGNASGLTVADFTFYNNAITIGNLAQDISIGTLGATGNVIFNRAIKVISPTTDAPSFSVNSEGLTSIYTPGLLDPTKAALNVVGTSDGNVQPRNYSSTLLQLTSQDNASARVSIDSFGSSGNLGGQNSLSSITARVARGSVNAPEQNLAYDVMFRLAGQAWNDVGSYQGNIIRLNMTTVENVTSTSAGTRFNFQATPIGSTIFQDVANIDTTGITLLNQSNIKFTNGSVQTIAFNPANVVTSLTVGTGLTSTGGLTQGTVSINATGVQNVVGTSNQVIVTDSGGKNLTLSLPQSINTNSSVQFGNITVGNLVVTGTQTAANTISINDKTFTLANNSTSSTQINGGGMILGNVLDGSYYRTFLYDLPNDRWSTDGAGLQTLELTSGNAFIQTLWANNSGHFGGAFTGNTYTGAVIQADSDTNSYSQIVNQNHSNGTDASADFVAVNDIGTDDSNYIDVGINSSTYSNPAYSISGANDGYVFVNGGNLSIGTQSAGKNVVFHTGNTTSSALRATISDSGLTVVGNISANNVISTNSLVAANLILSGNVNAPYTSAVLTTAAQPNVTSVGTLVSLAVSGNTSSGNISTTGRIAATGNVSGGNLNTNGQVVASGNITGGNVQTSLVSATTVVASGNITGGNLISSAGTFSSDVTATGNITGGNLNTGAQVIATGNIRGANFNTTGLVAATGNIDGGNLRTGGLIAATGNITTLSSLVGASITTTGNVSATGNISGTYILGNGSLLTGIVSSYGNSNVSTLLAGFGSNTITTTGNITGGNFIGNGSALTSLTGANVVGAVANATYATSAGTATTATTAGTVTGNAQANITSVGTLTALTVSGNVNGGNVISTALVSGVTLTASGNINGGNVISTALVSGATVTSSGNISATGNIASGNLSTTGNVYTNYGTFGNIIVGNNAIYSSSGSTDVNIGLVSATANININRNTNFANSAFVTGNVTATNFIGNGSQLTGVFTSSSILKGQLTVNPTNVGKTSASTQTFTLTGLTTNHHIVITNGTALTYGIFITGAWPSAADTLSIQFMNITGGGIDLGSIDIDYVAWL